MALNSIAGHLKALTVALKHALSPGVRVTLKYPDEVLILPPNYRGMISWDASKCIGCAMCAKVCPANAIRMRRLGKVLMPEEDYARCIFCGSCVDICPVGALSHTPIHDVVVMCVEEAYYDVSRRKGGVRVPPPKPKVKRVVVKFDEKRGILHVPSS